MEVQIQTAFDDAVEQFVLSHGDGKICHTYTWGLAIEKSIGLKHYYLVARHDDTIAGVLPLAHVRSRLFGNRMISQAFANYGGPLTDDAQAQQALCDYAANLASKLGCESIEYRNVQPLPLELSLRAGKACMHLTLGGDAEALWKGFDAKVRNQVRKAEKSLIVPADGGAELLDEFYDVYAVRMRQLGTPCFPKGMMRALLEAFPQNSRVFIVRLEGQAVGGGFTTCYNGLAEIPWASTLTEFNNLCPNNLLYWSVIKYYCQAGAKIFDFGRSTVGAGTWQFKKQWGPTQVDLNYQYWLAPGQELEIASPDNPRYKRKIEMWKKLPLWLTKILGPIISKNLA
jgi:serine/alanine adding enzyme